ncbi:MAG: hypothetical protein VX107_07315, partial [Pseudomonadota bacterium]|nr:hypothetical protein [Pseudomonadota bacterium]
LAAPAILIDPRVRSLSPQSFYDLTAEDIFGKIKQYLSGNGVLYSFIFAAGALGSFAELIAAILGFFRLSREHKAAAVVAFLILLYFLAINGPVATPKYRLPLEPVLILLTALGTLPLLRRVTKRGKN